MAARPVPQTTVTSGLFPPFLAELTCQARSSLQSRRPVRPRCQARHELHVRELTAALDGLIAADVIEGVVVDVEVRMVVGGAPIALLGRTAIVAAALAQRRQVSGRSLQEFGDDIV